MRAAQSLSAIAILLAASAWSAAAEFELRQIKEAGKLTAFEVAGLSDKEAAALAELPADDAAWQRILSVYVAGESPRGGIPPILGTYSIREDALRFTPKYPFKPGLKYRLAFQPAAVANPQATKFPGDRLATLYVTAPAVEKGEPAKVVAVYPSAITLPENQLRFYLHFSAPMSRGEVYQRVKLLDAQGIPVKYPFLEIGEELWDASGTRLTLLIDPGRIKRGLRPREEDGPVLEAGKKYKLVIDKRWRDASGRPLIASFEKPFSTGAPIEKALDTADWQIEPPASGSRQPLVVRFPAPLDHALLERTIDVVTADGQSILGDVAIADEEQTWRFTPDTPWQSGKHELAIDKTLEDLVGNRIGVPFEVDQTGPIDKQVKVEIHRVGFEIGCASDESPQTEVSDILKRCRDLLGKIDDERQRAGLDQEILRLETIILVKAGDTDEAVRLAAASSNPSVALVHVFHEHWRRTGTVHSKLSDLSAQEQRTFYELTLRTRPPPMGDYNQARVFLRRHSELSVSRRSSSSDAMPFARLAEAACIDNRPDEARKILELADELIEWPAADELRPATAMGAVSLARVWHRLNDRDCRDRFVEIANRSFLSPQNPNSRGLALSLLAQSKVRLHTSLAAAFHEFQQQSNAEKHTESAWEILQTSQEADTQQRGAAGWQIVAIELSDLQRDLGDFAGAKRTLSWAVDQMLNSDGRLRNAAPSPQLKYRNAKTIAWKMAIAGDVAELEAFLAKATDPPLRLSLQLILAQAHFDSDTTRAAVHLNAAEALFDKVVDEFERMESARALSEVCKKLGAGAKAARFADVYESLAVMDDEELRRRCAEYLESGDVKNAQSMVAKMRDPLHRAYGLHRIAAWMIETN